MAKRRKGKAREWVIRTTVISHPRFQKTLRDKLSVREAVAEIGGDPQQTWEKLVAKHPCTRRTTIGQRRAVRIVRTYEHFWNGDGLLVIDRYHPTMDPRVARGGLTY